MKNFSLVVLAGLISVASYAVDTTCEKDASRRVSANNALARVTAQQNNPKTAIEGLVSAESGNIGDTKGAICPSQWSSAALGLPIKQIAMLPACGLVVKFDTSAALEKFARTSLMLGSGVSTYVQSTDMKHTITRIVPVCAKLK